MDECPTVMQVCPGVFKNSDAAYILSYSVIMLNTDQHNKQVVHSLKSFVACPLSLLYGGSDGMLSVCLLAQRSRRR
jgi:Sec7 domain